MSEKAPTQTKALSKPVPTSTTPVQPEFLRSRPFADNSAAALSNTTAAQATSEPPPDWQTQLERASRYGFDFNKVKISGAPPPFVQRKLVIGAPGDQYEQEADRMAEQVMAMPEPANPQLQRKLLGNAIAHSIQRSSHTEAAFPQSNLLTNRITPIVQRQKQQQEEPIQTKSLLQGKATSSSNLENRLTNSKGGGSPLDDEVRSFMEPRIGANFSSVRVHTDSNAIQMNRELNAQAFTHGSDVYFGAGKYNPSSSDGKHLLAHELTHVVQQSGGGHLQTKMVQASFSDWWKTISNFFTNAQESKNFDTVADGNLKQADAPDKLKLPEELTEGMQEGWDKSLPDGKSQEQGGLLVKDKDGDYKWKPGKPGKSGSFSPNYSDQDKDETLVGVGHTHPYDASEGGHTDVSFSGQDLARLVYVKDRIAVVQSGEGQFVASRTVEFDKMLEKLDDAGKKKMFDEMKKTYDDALSSAKGKFQERVEAAVKAVCSKYHLVYYKGKNSKLTKQ
ncbi:MAG: DUF4157 domain-containing protein [Cyanobacteriota bacterium]